MKDKELLEKHVKPIFDELYKNVVNLFDEDIEINMDNIQDLALNIDDYSKLTKKLFKYNTNRPATYKYFPYTAFFIKEEIYHKILNKHTSQCKYHYVWPYRSEIIYTKKEIESFKRQMSEIEDKTSVEYLDIKHKVESNKVNKDRHELWLKYRKEVKDLEENLKNKTITKKEYDKKMLDLVPKYSLKKYSQDAEKISFSIALDLPSPMFYDEECFNRSKRRYNIAKCLGSLRYIYYAIFTKMFTNRVKINKMFDIEMAYTFYKKYKNKQTNESI